MGYKFQLAYNQPSVVDSNQPLDIMLSYKHRTTGHIPIYQIVTHCHSWFPNWKKMAGYILTGDGNI